MQRTNPWFNPFWRCPTQLGKLLFMPTPPVKLLAKERSSGIFTESAQHKRQQVPISSAFFQAKRGLHSIDFQATPSQVSTFSPAPGAWIGYLPAATTNGKNNSNALHCDVDLLWGDVSSQCTLSNEIHTSSQHNVCTCMGTHNLQNDTNQIAQPHIAPNAEH